MLLRMKQISLGMFCLAVICCESCKEPAKESPPPPPLSVDTSIVPSPESLIPAPLEPVVLTHKPLPTPSPIEWTVLETGLAYTEAEASISATIGDSRISLLRIDPTHFSFRLLSAKEGNHIPRKAPEWAEKEGLLALVNVGMYQADHLTNVGYMKNGDFLNQPKFNKDKAFFAFNPQSDTLPSCMLIDRECHPWQSLVDDYQAVTQSIRMIDCQRRNKWGKQQRFWSMVVICMDQKGRVIFAFTRSPYSVHDFINILLKFPLQIQQAMYLEGGPEASFYLNHPQKTVEKMGSYETGFWEDDTNQEFWRIPNVIGVVRRE